MKNNNENNRDGQDEVSVHEQLCAFVLGELNEEQARAMEVRLSDDADLRAERARLQATIGLVTDFCSEGESLSPVMMETLEQAAAPASTPIVQMTARPWYQAAPVRAAAGFVAIASGVVAGFTMMEPRIPPALGEPTFESLAKLETSDKHVRADSPTARVAVPEDTSGSMQDLRRGITGLASNPAGQINSKLTVNGRQSGGDVQGVARALELLATAGAAGADRQNELEAEITGVGTALSEAERKSGRDGSRHKLQDVLRETRRGDLVLPSQKVPVQFESSGVYHLSADTGTPTLGGGAISTAGGPGSPGALPTTVGFPIVTTGGLKSSRWSQVTAPGKEPLQRAADSKRQRGQVGFVANSRPALQGDPALNGLSKGTGSPGYLQGLQDIGYVDEVTSDAWGSGVSHSFWYGMDGESSRKDFGRTALTLQQRTDRILQGCRRQPNESPRDMFFRFWGDNSFELTQLDSLSTFSVDVDTASYALARRYLNGGTLPSKAQIRTEEFLNYFKADLPAPTEGTFSIHTELAPSRYGQSDRVEGQRWMLRVGVRGKDVAREERKALALTFVVDTSGSMKEGQRMELVKHALRLLVTQLDAADSIAIVGFNNSARVVLPMTSVQSRTLIEAAIFGLQPGGGTNAEGGLKLGYEVAATALTSQAHNRVVLLSDGVANVGQVDQDRINADVRERRESGIFLNTIGVGMGNHNDNFLEQLANKGDGLCNYVDSPAEARRALVENFIGAFETIARDVKIQVEFDPNQVYRYRLLGYENRAIADADFRNDAVDAGEVGAGHQVVALYELELTGAQSTEPMAQVNLRWKAPTGAGRDPREDSATEISSTVMVNSSQAWSGTSVGYKRSVIVAQFAEILRRSVHARGDSIDALLADARMLSTRDSTPDFAEFVGLLERSHRLIGDHAPQSTDLSDCIDALRRNRLLRAQLEDLRKTENGVILQQLEANNQELEEKVRELIRAELPK